LGVYGDATNVRRHLDNPDQYIGKPSLVIGGGNAAADIVAALSRAKRTAEDGTTVYWGTGGSGSRWKKRSLAI
jgi:cation diffusion facilitator CzcD-associated flavoprotein CzcO